MSDFVLALTTLPGNADAEPLARQLVEARVAACVNIVPGVRSVYTWEGATQVEPEQQLLIKTTRDRVDALWSAIRERHPYQVPEFIVVPIESGNPAYLKWIEESVIQAPAANRP